MTSPVMASIETILWSRSGTVESRPLYFFKRLGLKAIQANAFEHLASIPENSLGGIFCSHFIEHFQSDAILDFMILCFQKLDDGAYLVIETPNPCSLIVGASTFYRDPTHRMPYHPESVKFILKQIGFQHVIIEETSFLRDQDRLRKIPHPSNLSRLDPVIMDTLKVNFDWLNHYLCSPQDYTAIGQKIQTRASDET